MLDFIYSLKVSLSHHEILWGSHIVWGYNGERRWDVLGVLLHLGLMNRHSFNLSHWSGMIIMVNWHGLFFLFKDRCDLIENVSYKIPAFLLFFVSLHLKIRLERTDPSSPLFLVQRCGSRLQIIWVIWLLWIRFPWRGIMHTIWTFE